MVADQQKLDKFLPIYLISFFSFFDGFISLIQNMSTLDVQLLQRITIIIFTAAIIVVLTLIHRNEIYHKNYQNYNNILFYILMAVLYLMGFMLKFDSFELGTIFYQFSLGITILLAPYYLVENKYVTYLVKLDQKAKVKDLLCDPNLFENPNYTNSNSIIPYYTFAYFSMEFFSDISEISNFQIFYLRKQKGFIEKELCYFGNNHEKKLWSLNIIIKPDIPNYFRAKLPEIGKNVPYHYQCKLKQFNINPEKIQKTQSQYSKRIKKYETLPSQKKEEIVNELTQEINEIFESEGAIDSNDYRYYFENPYPENLIFDTISHMQNSNRIKVLDLKVKKIHYQDSEIYNEVYCTQLTKIWEILTFRGQSIPTIKNKLEKWENLQLQDDIERYLEELQKIGLIIQKPGKKGKKGLKGLFGNRTRLWMKLNYRKPF